MNSFALEVLAMAFARHVLDGLVGEKATPEQRALIQRVCPSDQLIAAGLMDPAGHFTSAWIEARAQALDRLPRELSHDQRLLLLTSLFEVCVTGGQLDRDDGSMLFQTASLLGIRPSEFDAHLDTLTDHVGAIDLDTPEL